MRLKVCPHLKRRYCVDENSRVRSSRYAKNLLDDSPLGNINCSIKILAKPGELGVLTLKRNSMESMERSEEAGQAL